MRLSSLFCFENPALKIISQYEEEEEGHRLPCPGYRCIIRVVRCPVMAVRTDLADRPVPEATEKNAEQAAERLHSTAGYFVPKPLTETDCLMNVGLYPPYLMQLWLCLQIANFLMYWT